MDGYKKDMPNGLAVSVDWLGYTIKDMTVDAVVAFMGFKIQEFSNTGHGANGYRQCLKCHGEEITVLFDGTEEMGVHVNVTGSAVSSAMEHFSSTMRINTPFGVGYNIDIDSTFLREYLKAIRCHGQLTRLDIAVDDFGSNYYAVKDVVEVMEDRRAITLFRKWRNVSARTTSGEYEGHTLYLGNRQSEIFMRVYDKKAEQNVKLKSLNKPLIVQEWVRWELELKKDRANQFASLLIAGQEIGEVCIGVLTRYFRIIELDDCNRSRCSTDALWESFCDGILKRKLTVNKEERTLEKARDWLYRQVAPTLASVVLADGGTIDFVQRLLEVGEERIDYHMQQLIQYELSHATS